MWTPLLTGSVQLLVGSPPLVDAPPLIMVPSPTPQALVVIAWLLSAKVGPDAWACFTVVVTLLLLPLQTAKAVVALSLLELAILPFNPRTVQEVGLVLPSEAPTPLLSEG